MDQFKHKEEEKYPANKLVYDIVQDTDQIRNIQVILELHRSTLENILDTPFEPNGGQIGKIIQGIGQELEKFIQKDDILQRNLSSLLNNLNTLKGQVEWAWHAEKMIPYVEQMAHEQKDLCNLIYMKISEKIEKALLFSSMVQDEEMVQNELIELALHIQQKLGIAQAL